MHINEYTISPHLRDILQQAFEPYLEQMQSAPKPLVAMPPRNGEKPLPALLQKWPVSGAAKQPIPLKEWIKKRQQLPLDHATSMQLAATLETILALDGGPEGVHLLESLDGVLNSGGAPALLIHGLPVAVDGKPDVSGVLHEAFRQLMLPERNAYFQPGLRFKDEYDANLAGNFTRDSVSLLHQDGNDYSMLAGVKAGANPRHTVLLTADELVKLLVAQVAVPGSDQKALEKDFLVLLQLPIWSEVENDQSISGHYPFLVQNLDFHPHEAHSQPYQFNQMRMADIRTSMKATSVPEARSLELLKDAVAKICDKDIDLAQGPVLDAGDLLMFNDRLLIHAGGPHIHARVEQGADALVAREILAYDVDSSVVPQYAVRPGDRISKPIHIDRVHGASLDLGEHR